MKTTIFTLALLAATCSISNATIRTVSNFPTGTIAQYSTIQAAIDASTPTILPNGILNVNVVGKKSN